MTNAEQDARLPLARATLVALYATAGVVFEESSAAPVWLPDLRPAPVDEVVRRLAALRPGITCVGFATGRDIAIGAWEDRARDGFKDEVLELMLQDIRARTPRYSPADYQVTVRGDAGDVASLTWPQYEQWTREFALVAPTIRLNAVVSPSGEHPPALTVTISPPSPDGWVSGTYL